MIPGPKLFCYRIFPFSMILRIRPATARDIKKRGMDSPNGTSEYDVEVIDLALMLLQEAGDCLYYVGWVIYKSILSTEEERNIFGVFDPSIHSIGSCDSLLYHLPELSINDIGVLLKILLFFPSFG